MSDDATRNYRTIVLARALHANFTLSIIAVGIHVFMALYGLSVFLETPPHLRKGRKRYIITSFALTILSGLAASLDMASDFQILFEAHSPSDWIALHAKYGDSWERRLNVAAMGLLLLIADGLLVYRCYMVWLEHRWVAILPGMTSLAAVVLFYLANNSSEFARILPPAPTLLTVITSIIVTGLITFRLLRARRTFLDLLPSSDGNRIYTEIITVLIESAAPLAIFGIIVAGLRLSAQSGALLRGSPGFIVCALLFDGLFYTFCGLSPHMIIFRVTTGRSFTKFATNPIDGSGLSNTIRFAHQTAEASFLQSTFNREHDQKTGLHDRRRRSTSDAELQIESSDSAIHMAQEKVDENGDVQV